MTKLLSELFDWPALRAEELLSSPPAKLLLSEDPISTEGVSLGRLEKIDGLGAKTELRCGVIFGDFMNLPLSRHIASLTTLGERGELWIALKYLHPMLLDDFTPSKERSYFSSPK